MKTIGYLLIALVAVNLVYAQTLPQYEIAMRHPVLVGGSTYQFDLYIKRLGSANFRIGNSQFIMTFNAGQFASPAISRVPSSEQIGANYFFDQEIIDNQIRITLGGNGSYTNASDISTTSEGTKISSYRITGVNVPVLSPQLSWVNLPDLVRTGVSGIDAADNYYDITDVTGVSHISGGGEFGQISGFKFDDLNGNGVWNQPAEPPLDGWTITLTGPGGISSAITGNGAWSDGYYEFVNLSPGDYSIDEVTQSNWSTTTSPANPVALVSGANLQNMNFGNYNGPAILGLVFNDNDGSGTKDNGEGGLAGWLVLADKVGGGGSKSAVTNSTGDYSFVFSPSESGLWVVSQSPQTGWAQTYPVSPSAYTIDIQSGTYATGKDFGNFRTCSISGMKFNDSNRDSSKQSAEPGISGWRIRLLKNGIQVDSILTDADGNYSFSNLTAGSYTVAEAQNPGWSQTYPPPPGVHTVIFNSGGLSSAGKYFGNYHIIPVGGIGQIGGKKFEDMNGNGIEESGDNGLQGWRIRLYSGSIEIDSQLTDINGNYLFQNLDDGIYTVSEAAQTGWFQTLPGGTGSYDITIGIDQRIFTVKDFGNFHTGTITGMVYRDVNHNGHLDGGEPGMAGIQIKLTDHLGGIQHASTIVGGVWTSTGLAAGEYNVAEELPVGYHLTDPPGGTYTVDILSGTDITNILFGTSVATDTIRFRTFSYDSLTTAKDTRGRIGLAVRKKSNRVEFRAVFKNTLALPINGIHMYFSPPLILGDVDHPFTVTPVPSRATFAQSPKNAIADFVWDDSIHTNDSVVIKGWGSKGKYESITYAWQLSHGGKKLKPTFTLNQPGLPMPNVLNVRDEIFKKSGFGNDGLIVGKVDLVHLKTYGWVRMKSINSVQQSIIYRSTIHSTMGRGFDNFENNNDFIREQRKLPPVKQNNRLFADLMTLKLNIKASEMKLIQPGLGELVYDDGINPLSGKSLREIADTTDQALTYWQYLLPQYFIHLDTTIKKILTAFEGPVDTLSFAAQLKLKGVKQLIDVPFLRAVAGVKPVIIKEDLIEFIPDKFELYQNYPNPFNPSTSIRLNIPAYGKVSLKIYNLLGQEISTLLDEVTLDAGEEEVIFDASAVGGLPSGVYFARSTFQALDDEELSGVDYVQIRKMLLIR